VLPAHEWRFRGLAARVKQLLVHHDERLAEIVTVLGAEPGGDTTWDVAKQLTWSRGWDGIAGFQRRAALAESAAHLDQLVGTGVLIGSVDDDGVAHYRPVTPPATG
jgi:hypothetical protein